MLPGQGTNGQLTITASGGLALYPHDGQTWDELFLVAEARLSEAKKTKNRMLVGP